MCKFMPGSRHRIENVPIPFTSESKVFESAMGLGSAILVTSEQVPLAVVLVGGVWIRS